MRAARSRPRRRWPNWRWRRALCRPGARRDVPDMGFYDPDLGVARDAPRMDGRPRALVDLLPLLSDGRRYRAGRRPDHRPAPRRFCSLWRFRAVAQGARRGRLAQHAILTAHPPAAIVNATASRPKATMARRRSTSSAARCSRSRCRPPAAATGRAPRAACHRPTSRCMSCCPRSMAGCSRVWSASSRPARATPICNSRSFAHRADAERIAGCRAPSRRWHRLATTPAA